MKIKILIVLFFLNLCFSACNEIEESNLNSKINTFLSNTDDETLTNGYQFKIYNDGVGKDIFKPIPNDTILILKNEFSKKIISSKINRGKVLLLDSTKICELSYKHDQKREVMRSFLFISQRDRNKDLSLEIKNWVPQYYKQCFKCVEVSIN